MRTYGLLLSRHAGGADERKVVGASDQKKSAQLGETIWIKVSGTKRATELDLTTTDRRKCGVITCVNFLMD
jgi:hypothetical protein